MEYELVEAALRRYMQRFEVPAEWVDAVIASLTRSLVECRAPSARAQDEWQTAERDYLVKREAIAKTSNKEFDQTRHRTP